MCSHFSQIIIFRVSFLLFRLLIIFLLTFIVSVNLRGFTNLNEILRDITENQISSGFWDIDLRVRTD